MIDQEEILKALDTMRPFLQADDGDIEFVELTADGIVKVRFVGACGICPLNQLTLRAGIERSLMRQVPGVRRVESVEND
ncbi:MAG: NifU family protein [Syntrophothermus sp.]|nr:NifU family protein [Ignavibacteriaceae bacterium]